MPFWSSLSTFNMSSALLSNSKQNTFGVKSILNTHHMLMDDARQGPRLRYSASWLPSSRNLDPTFLPSMFPYTSEILGIGDQIQFSLSPQIWNAVDWRRNRVRRLRRTGTRRRKMPPSSCGQISSGRRRRSSASEGRTRTAFNFNVDDPQTSRDYCFFYAPQ